MAYWNKVSPTVLTSTTLDMASPKGQWEHGLLDLLALFRSWQLLCLSWEAVGWLSMWWSRHLLSVYSTIKSSIFNTLFSDDGEELQACIPWRVPLADIFSVGTRFRCQQRMTFAVFKAIFDMDVCTCSFSLPSTSIRCDFQTLAISGLSKEEDGRVVLLINSYFLDVVLCIISYLLYRSLFSSIYIGHETHFWVSLSKKKKNIYIYTHTMSSYQLAIAARTIVQPDGRLRGQRCRWRETQRCNADGEYSIRMYVSTCTHACTFWMGILEKASPFRDGCTTGLYSYIFIYQLFFRGGCILQPISSKVTSFKKIKSNITSLSSFL